jgi:HEAT repeat protein
MKSLGSLPLKDALEIIFSARDLRAINLLDKLNKAEDSQEEKILLGALHGTPSNLSINGLLERAGSPRLATRLEAIRALEKLKSLNAKAEKALIDDIIHNQYTTAYISARILGKHGCKEAVPLLREFIASNDFMLAGEAMIALAKMNDEEYRSQIENTIIDTKNPRVKIMGIEALGIYRCPDSLLVLLNLLHKAEPHFFLREEIVLSMAAILGTQKQFYPVLVKYVANNSLAVTLGLDEADATLEFCNTIIAAKRKGSKKSVLELSNLIENFQNFLNEYMKNKNGEELSQWILGLPDECFKNGIIAKHVLSETVMDNEYNTYNCLRLMISHWAAQKLRELAVNIK